MNRMPALALICAATLGGCNETYTFAPFGPPCSRALLEGDTGFMPRGTAEKETARFDYYRCMARRDDQEGQYRLGFAYEEGLGADVDLDKARRWYEQAAEPRSGIRMRQSWLSGSTYGQWLPYASGQARPGHRRAALRLENLPVSIEEN